jgi:hypothetical protein
MEGPALTTTRTAKYKLKLTKAKREQLEMDMFHYNKQRKRKGEAKVTFDEYLDIRCGRVTKRKLHPSEQGQLDPNYLSLPPHRQNDIKYPSLNSDRGLAVKKDVQHYTGENMLGIGQLHKSNSVPVFRKEDAEDQAKMRRG